MILPDLEHLPGVHRGSTALANALGTCIGRAFHEDVAARGP